MSTACPNSPTTPGHDARSEAERNFRWNAGWFVVDYLTFGIGMAFLNQSTVLPTFVSRLTDSALLIGLVATIQSGAWLLPQLIAASIVAGKPRKRPYMLRPAIVGRPVFPLLAVFIVAVGPDNPTLLLVALYAAMILFGVCDGLVSVPWFDILGKAIPANRRGRLLGSAQIITGLSGVVVGGVVAYVLAHPALSFPQNYAALFVLAGVAYLLGLIALAMIREPVRLSQKDQRRSLPAFLALLGPALRGDSRFRRVIAVRLVFGAGAMIFPFYIVHASRVLPFGPEYVGLFLSAQVLGGVVGGFLLGQLADRRGAQSAIRAGVAIAALSPGLALVTHFAGAALGALLLYATAATFVAIGVTFSSYLLAFMNYVLEIAPPDDRSTYAGLFNTINGTLLFAPAFAGWFLEATSYPALFAVALLLMLLAGIRLVAGLGSS